MIMNPLKFLALPAAMLLAGCATFSKDGGFDPVAHAARERLGEDVRWQRGAADKEEARRRTEELLAHPLSVQSAVEIALLDNPTLQASFEELGIAEADLVESGRLPNPRFTLRHSSTGGVYDIEETASVDVLALLTMPWVHAAEKRRFAAVQIAAMGEVAALAARARDAYFTAVAARMLARYRREVYDAAEAGAELARRMRAAGNFSALDEARERSFRLDASNELERGELAATLARESLIETLGVDGSATGIDLAETLPDLPPTLEPAANLDAALEARLDLKAMREALDALARSLDLSRARRFMDVLDAGPTRVKEGPAATPYETGYEVTFVVPIFDGGAPRTRRAAARYAQAVDRFAAASLEARMQIREAYAAYRAAHAIAVRERDEVLPLRQSIAAQDLERYNAAQISVFDLLADARAAIAANAEHIESVRDFWIARSALDAALLGPPPAAPRVPQQNSQRGDTP
jgi:outer membrane protein TolC